MGISTHPELPRRADFEAIGLRPDVIDHYFTWTPSRIGGIGLDVIAEEVAGAPRARLPGRPVNGHDSGRRRPVSVAQRGRGPPLQPRSRSHKLQHAVRTDNYKPSSRNTRELINDQSSKLCTLRGLLDFKRRRRRSRSRKSSRSSDRQALRHRRDVATARSAGSARDAGHRHEPHRRQEQHRRRRRGPGALHARRRTATRTNSAIKQVAVGRFGVTSEYLVNAERTADQDGPGRQARRRRPAARPQGGSVDRQDPPHARRASA